MKEKENITDRYTLRTHHLDLWQNLIEAFDMQYHSYPWQKPDENFEEFVRNYAYDELAKELTIQMFAEHSITGVFTKEEIGDFQNFQKEYYADVIGSDNMTRRQTVEKRIRVYLEFYRLCQEDKLARIYLVDEPDSYCHTCAVGKHCTQKVEDNNNNDLLFRKILMDLIESKEGGLVSKKDLIGVEDGIIFVTPELLFATNFYEYLTLKMGQ